MAERTFFGAIERRQEGEGVTLTTLTHSAGRALPLHPHQRAYFALLLSGGYTEETRTRRIEYRRGTLVFHPPDFAHADVIAAHGARFFIVEVEGAHLPRRMNDLRQYPDLTARMLGLYCRFLESDFDSGDFLDAAAAIVGPARIDSEAPRWLARAVEKIQAEYRSALTVNRLASDAGVHPIHFSRVFRHHLGTGVSDYLRRLRAAEAISMMTNKGVTIAQAAHACGFADHAHFTRVCRELTGRAPCQLREHLVPPITNHSAVDQAS